MTSLVSKCTLKGAFTQLTVHLFIYLNLFECFFIDINVYVCTYCIYEGNKHFANIDIEIFITIYSIKHTYYRSSHQRTKNIFWKTFRSMKYGKYISVELSNIIYDRFKEI